MNDPQRFDVPIFHMGKWTSPGSNRTPEMVVIDLDTVAGNSFAMVLPRVTGSDYMVEHCLAAYAVLLLG